jgi:hypothetical protein
MNTTIPEAREALRGYLSKFITMVLNKDLDVLSVLDSTQLSSAHWLTRLIELWVIRSNQATGPTCRKVNKGTQASLLGYGIEWKKLLVT